MDCYRSTPPITRNATDYFEESIEESVIYGPERDSDVTSVSSQEETNLESLEMAKSILNEIVDKIITDIPIETTTESSTSLQKEDKISVIVNNAEIAITESVSHEEVVESDTLQIPSSSAIYEDITPPKNVPEKNKETEMVPKEKIEFKIDKNEQKRTRHKTIGDFSRFMHGIVYKEKKSTKIDKDEASKKSERISFNTKITEKDYESLIQKLQKNIEENQQNYQTSSSDEEQLVSSENTMMLSEKTDVLLENSKENAKLSPDSSKTINNLKEQKNTGFLGEIKEILHESVKISEENTKLHLENKEIDLKSSNKRRNSQKFFEFETSTSLVDNAEVISSKDIENLSSTLIGKSSKTLQDEEITSPKNLELISSLNRETSSKIEKTMSGHHEETLFKHKEISAKDTETSSPSKNSETSSPSKDSKTSSPSKDSKTSSPSKDSVISLTPKDSEFLEELQTEVVYENLYDTEIIHDNTDLLYEENTGLLHENEIILENNELVVNTEVEPQTYSKMRSRKSKHKIILDAPDNLEIKSKRRHKNSDKQQEKHEIQPTNIENIAEISESSHTITKHSTIQQNDDHLISCKNNKPLPVNVNKETKDDIEEHNKQIKINKPTEMANVLSKTIEISQKDQIKPRKNRIFKSRNKEPVGTKITEDANKKLAKTLLKKPNKAFFKSNVHKRNLVISPSPEKNEVLLNKETNLEQNNKVSTNPVSLTQKNLENIEETTSKIEDKNEPKNKMSDEEAKRIFKHLKEVIGTKLSTSTPETNTQERKVTQNSAKRKLINKAMVKEYYLDEETSQSTSSVCDNSNLATSPEITGKTVIKRISKPRKSVSFSEKLTEEHIFEPVDILTDEEYEKMEATTQNLLDDEVSGQKLSVDEDQQIAEDIHEDNTEESEDTEVLTSKKAKKHRKFKVSSQIFKGQKPGEKKLDPVVLIERLDIENWTQETNKKTQRTVRGKGRPLL